MGKPTYPKTDRKFFADNLSGVSVSFFFPCSPSRWKLQPDGMRISSIGPKQRDEAPAGFPDKATIETS